MRILIVDDEAATRNGLATQIRWRSFGIDEVLTAPNGVEALELARLHPPDILLTDIRMPGMLGVELAAQIRALYPECAIVFLSGYSDKEYLQAAIRLSAVSYIEKPVMPSELEETITLAVSKARKEKRQREHAQLDTILAQNLPVIRQKALLHLISDADISVTEYSNLRLLHCFHDPEQWFVCYMIALKRPCADPDAFERQLLERIHLPSDRLLYAFKDARHYLVTACAALPRSLLLQSELGQALETYVREHPEAYLAIGEPEQGLERLRQSYLSAAVNLQGSFYLGYGETGSRWNATFVNVLPGEEEYLRRFEACVVARDADGAAAVLDEIAQKLRGDAPLLPSLVRSLFFRLFSLLRAAAFTPEQGVDSDLWQTLSDCLTLDELRDLLLARLEESVSGNSGSRTSSRVIQYIQTHYNDPELSVREIAAEMFLTPTYLSNLFAKQTGQTLKQYITEYRIHESLRYLRSDEYKLYQIAFMVGYTDANYFARAFKKQTGQTPSEYKESMP